MSNPYGNKTSNTISEVLQNDNTFPEEMHQGSDLGGQNSIDLSSSGINSDLIAQIIKMVAAATAKPIQILDSAGTEVFSILPSGNLKIGTVEITSTPTELNALDGILASVAELNHMQNASSEIQSQINAITTLLTNLSQAELGTLNGVVATLTGIELNSLDGISSNVQAQLDLLATIASPTFTGIVTVAEIVSSTYKNIYAPASENPLLWSGIVHYAWDTVSANAWVVLTDTNGSLPADLIAWDSYSLVEKIVVNISKFKIVLDNLLNGSSSSSSHTVRWYYSLDSGVSWTLGGTATGITTTNTVFAAFDVTEVEFFGRDVTGDVRFRLTQFRNSGSSDLDCNTLTVHVESKIGAV